MSRKTNAIRLLDRAGIVYSLHEYEITMDEFSAGAVADLIGMARNLVFKTLVVSGRDTGPCFAVIPADTELDLKALAVALGDKRVEMTPVRDVEPLTGYVRGGVTALGSRKRMPVVLDASAAGLDEIAVSAGVKGLQVRMATTEYIALTGARMAPIAA